MPEPHATQADQRLLIHGITWAQYEAMRALTDHVAGLHLTYLSGVLEITSPSSRHERIKTLLARLIETYAEERDLQLTGLGSTTYRRPEMASALEPDECYVLGGPKETPDLAIEVVITSGGIDRLAVYRALEVPEVWFWVDGHLAIFRLGTNGYDAIKRSVLFPELDPVELTGIVAATGDFDQTQAVRAFRQRLGKS